MLSSSEIATDTADSEIGNSAAAAAIEPRSATATKYSICRKVIRIKPTLSEEDPSKPVFDSG
jgi:hypothetical protein